MDERIQEGPADDWQPAEKPTDKVRSRRRARFGRHRSETYDPPDIRAIVRPMMPLASPPSRLGAYLLDLAVAWAAAFVVVLLTFPRNGDPGRTAPSDVLLLIFLALCLSGVQICLLAFHGQTIGKKLVGIRIVRYDNEENPGFGRVIMLRAFLPALIAGILTIVFIGPVLLLVDLLFIFREDHRCIHDHIAGTKVVKL